MTVRVWLKPNELGEQGYFIEFAEAGGYEAIEDGSLLLFAGRSQDTQVGIVNVGRWDAAQLMGETVESTDDEVPPG